MKKNILILAGLSLFAVGNFAGAQILDGISVNQRSQYATKSTRHFIMNLHRGDEHGVTIQGTGFFIDSASLDRFDVHDCGDDIKIVTTRDATLYTMKADPSKNRKADSSVQFNIEKRLEEYDEVEVIPLYPALIDRDITSNIAILALKPDDVAWFRSIPERLRPKCIGMGTRGVAKAPDANTTLYGYTENMLSPSEINLSFAENLELSKKLISLQGGYLYAANDGRKIDGVQSLKGSIVLNKDHQTPAGMVVGVTDDGRFQVASINSVEQEVRYLTTVTDEQKRVRYAFTYLQGSEEIEYRGVRFNEISKRLAYRFGLPTQSVLNEIDRVAQLPPSADNQRYLDMLKSLDAEEMRKKNFDTTKVAVSQGISEDSPLSGSLSRILNLGDIDTNAKVMVHKVNQNSIATLYDLMVALKTDSGFPARSTLDQGDTAATMNISVKPVSGDEKFYVTGTFEKDTLNTIRSKMGDFITDYKSWLGDYITKNKPNDYYSGSTTTYNSSTGAYTSAPTSPPPGWGVSTAGYQLVTFMRLKLSEHYAYGQESTSEKVTFSPEESLIYINKLMGDYFNLLIGLDEINNNPQLSEDRKSALIKTARSNMLGILDEAGKHTDLIKSLHDGSNLVDTSQNNIEQRVLDMIRSIGDLKTSCHNDLERLGRLNNAIQRYK